MATGLEPLVGVLAGAEPLPGVLAGTEPLPGVLAGTEPLPGVLGGLGVSERERLFATLAGLSVTASLPFFLYGAWYALDVDVMTWARLKHHLAYVLTGLVLTTVPVVGWMIPRLLDQLSGPAVLHAILGLQAYALLVFGLTGIVRIFEAKWRADLYRDPDPDADIDELHENMPAWRKRLRIGVFGFLIFWILAYLVGVVRFVRLYLL